MYWICLRNVTFSTSSILERAGFDAPSDRTLCLGARFCTKMGKVWYACVRRESLCV